MVVVGVVAGGRLQGRGRWGVRGQRQAGRGGSDGGVGGRRPAGWEEGGAEDPSAMYTSLGVELVPLRPQRPSRAL